MLHMSIKVYIVDDRLEMRLLLRINLEKLSEGIDVCGEAESGEEALRNVVQASPDVVIADVNLPGMSGVELVAEIRRGIPNIKIIMASMLGIEVFGASALAAGADAVVSKTDMEKIPGIVRELVGCKVGKDAT